VYFQLAWSWWSSGQPNGFGGDGSLIGAGVAGNVVGGALAAHSWAIWWVSVIGGELSCLLNPVCLKQ